MATRRNPRFKECRRLGTNVCGHPKAMAKAGNQGYKRRKPTEYSLQLTEKQKLKAYYGILEKQLRNYYAKANKKDIKTGDALVGLLEIRLDNFVYRLGIASSIRQARQLVNHGHILVNSKKIDIPSYQISVGDKITLREKSRKNEILKKNFLGTPNFNLPYITKDEAAFGGVLSRFPARNEVPIEVNDQLVVEFYSR